MFYSLTGKAAVIGDLYDGSMLDGDREATAGEFAAWELARAPTKDQQIAALLATRGLTRGNEWLLYSGMAALLAAATMQGKTEAQLLASNPGYANAKTLAQAIALKRAEP